MWLFYVAIFVGFFFLILIGENIHYDVASVLIVLFWLGANIAFLAVGIRRLHDMDQTGWWILAVLVPIANIILLIALLFVPGTEGENPYGPDPRQVNQEME